MASIVINTERAIYGAAIIEMERPPNSRKLHVLFVTVKVLVESLDERTAIEKPGAAPARVGFFCGPSGQSMTWTTSRLDGSTK